MNLVRVMILQKGKR